MASRLYLGAGGPAPSPKKRVLKSQVEIPQAECKRRFREDGGTPQTATLTSERSLHARSISNSERRATSADRGALDTDANELYVIQRNQKRFHSAELICQQSFHASIFHDVDTDKENQALFMVVDYWLKLSLL